MKHAPSKRGATLWALEQNGICSRDLKTKVFREIFPTEATITSYLEKKGLSFDNAPEIMSDWGMDGIVAQEGGLGEDEFGILPEEQEWLKKFCNILGLKYNDGGCPYKRPRRAFDIDVPANWYFDPQRKVKAKEMCWQCRKLILKANVAYDSQGCSYCARCYKKLRSKRYL